ncbi:cyclophilin-like fold protein [Rhodoferax sediminis]|uniref:Cyclophilin-like domain-containing protein n=1 Tax=Rhodoferax sediminis TaxID=2509614 RepID=A0A515DE90_9BURK|nr:cyclophilin-like fold protein [Rhodoferax sediminis]QDL38709.1 hypothetical protein EUB48_16465 [Rhodoferax sediminis]
MKLRLEVGNSRITASVIDSGTARDFLSLLPLQLRMGDLHRREKCAHLPRPLSESGTLTKNYEVGDLAYRLPEGDIAVFYRHDGQTVPTGLITIAKANSHLKALSAEGPVDVTIDLAK